MIRDDLLWAQNLTLLPLALFCAFFSIKFDQYMADKGYDGQPDGFRIVVRCITVLTCGIAFSAILWLLWDMNVLSLVQQQNLSIVMRGFFVYGIILACLMFLSAVRSTWRKWFLMGVTAWFIGVYTIAVMVPNG